MLVPLRQAVSKQQLAVRERFPSHRLSQGKGVPKKGVPAIPAIDQQLGNCSSYRESYCALLPSRYAESPY